MILMLYSLSDGYLANFNLMIQLHFGLDATATLDGVELRWTRLILPYVLNFVQVKLVSNLTEDAANDDSNGFETLPIIFQNARTLALTIPKSSLIDGQEYAFRLGFPFATYNYYTNALRVKTFDASSPFVNTVQSASTHSNFTISWLPPEYADRILGYSLRVLYNQTENAADPNPRYWNTSALHVFDSRALSLSQTTQTVTCSTLNTNACISQYTTYVVEISVIREDGKERPSYFYVSTLKTPVIVVKTDKASFNLYQRQLTITFVNNISHYPANTNLLSTPFSPLYVKSNDNNFLYYFGSGVVESLASTVLRISFSENEYLTFVERMFAIPFSPLTLYHSKDKSINLTISCLLLC